MVVVNEIFHFSLSERLQSFFFQSLFFFFSPRPSHALRRSRQGVFRALCGRRDGICAWLPSGEDINRRKSRRARSK